MEFLSEIFQYKFLLNATIASLLAGVACGVVGTYIVCRRQVFLSGGVTHASFGGIGIAYFMGINPILGALVFAVLSALGIEASSSRGSLREDSAIGILWSVGMAVGIIFIHLTPGTAPNLMSYLFGNILSVTATDLFWMGVAVSVIIAVFALFYRPIVYTAFDRNYSRSQKVPIKFIGYLMAALTAATIVISIRVVGIVLLISLLTVPAVAANMLSNNMARVMVIASCFAVGCTFIGLYVSYKSGVPSGASTIIVLMFTLIVVKLLSLRVGK